MSVVVNAPLAKVWECWTLAEHIKGWAFASDDWEVGEVSNDPTTGGKFSTIIRAKDGSASFDQSGVCDEVVPKKNLSYTIEDGRAVGVTFLEVDGGVNLTEVFEIENENSDELQRDGWQSILDNFKKYAESV